jgi:hypothetical protein
MSSVTDGKHLPVNNQSLKNFIGGHTMYNEKSKKNLKMFSKTNQPSKRGRPKGFSSLKGEIKKVMDVIDESSNKRIMELLAISAVKHAIKGNAAYFKEILSCYESEETNNSENPVQITFVYKDAGRNNDLK